MKKTNNGNRAGWRSWITGFYGPLPLSLETNGVRTDKFWYWITVTIPRVFTLKRLTKKPHQTVKGERTQKGDQKASIHSDYQDEKVIWLQNESYFTKKKYQIL